MVVLLWCPTYKTHATPCVEYTVNLLKKKVFNNTVCVLNLQITKYIFCSLILAALHVCGCAFVLKINTQPDTSRPAFVWRLLFVHCTQRSFWIKLVQRCSRYCTCRVPRHSDTNSSTEATPAQRKECFHTQVTDSTHSQSNIQELVKAKDDILTANKKCDSETSEQNIVDKNAKQLEMKHTWNDVAVGLSRLITTTYFLCNVLVFALCMFPLLSRITVYMAVKDWSPKL